MLRSAKVASKNTYYVTVDIKEFYGAKKEQFELIVDAGKKPTIGDYIAMIKKNLGIEMEIKEIAPYIEFKPTTPVERGIQLVRVVRSINDATY